MVSKGRVDGALSHLCFECLVGDRYFVFDICSAQLIIIIVTYNVASEDCEVDRRPVNELIHGRECGQCKVGR